VKPVGVLVLVVLLAALLAGHVRGGSDGPAPTGGTGRPSASVHPAGTGTSGAASTGSDRAAGTSVLPRPPYTGRWHESLSGNQVPDDCRAWAYSSSNTRSHSDGLDLCRSGG
jgi:hypothetical protein